MRAASTAVLLLGVLTLGGCGASGERDARTVYCLAGGPGPSTDRAALLDSAAALGLGTRVGDQLETGGLRVGVDQWRRDFPEDFDRACSALFDSTRTTAPGGAPEWVTSLVGAVVGALSAFLGAWFAWYFARRKDAETRELNRLVETRGALETFINQVDRFVDAQVRGVVADAPTETVIRESRRRLRTRLALVSAPDPTEAIRALDADPLGEGLVPGFLSGGSVAARRDRGTAVRAALDDLHTRVEAVIAGGGV